MSDQLLRAIESVKSRIANNPDAFKTETPTKQSLILPVLDALGWDVFDHARVQSEYETESGRADWALKVEDEEAPVIFIEAKSLSTNIDEKERRQLSRYCFDEGVPTALITNGNEWFAYRPLLVNLDFRHRLLFQLRLDRDDAAASAKKLNLLRYEDISKLDNEDINIWLNAYWDKQAKDELLNAFSGVLRDSIVDWSGRGSGEFPAGKVKTWLRKKMFPGGPPSVRKRRPQHTSSSRQETGRTIVLDGEHIPSKPANGVLIKTAEWLVARGKLQHSDCPVGLEQSRYQVHTRAQHDNGSPFASPKELSNGLFLEINHSGPDCIRKALELLKICGYTSPGEILQVRE